MKTSESLVTGVITFGINCGSFCLASGAGMTVFGGALLDGGVAEMGFEEFGDPMAAFFAVGVSTLSDAGEAPFIWPHALFLAVG